MLSVMQAYKEGKTIEQKSKNTDSVWRINRNPVWNWDKGSSCGIKNKTMA